MTNTFLPGMGSRKRQSKSHSLIQSRTYFRLGVRQGGDSQRDKVSGERKNKAAEDGGKTRWTKDDTCPSLKKRNCLPQSLRTRRLYCQPCRLLYQWPAPKVKVLFQKRLNNPTVLEIVLNLGQWKAESERHFDVFLSHLFTTSVAKYDSKPRDKICTYLSSLNVG